MLSNIDVTAGLLSTWLMQPVAWLFLSLCVHVSLCLLERCPQLYHLKYMRRASLDQTKDLDDVIPYSPQIFQELDTGATHSDKDTSTPCHYTSNDCLILSNSK